VFRQAQHDIMLGKIAFMIQPHHTKIHSGNPYPQYQYMSNFIPH
jgi:hypothetical protein